MLCFVTRKFTRLSGTSSILRPPLPVPNIRIDWAGHADRMHGGTGTRHAGHQVPTRGEYVGGDVLGQHEEGGFERCKSVAINSKYY